MDESDKTWSKPTIVQKHTEDTRKIAKLFGADLFGVAGLDTRWHYTKRVNTRDFSPVENDFPDNLVDEDIRLIVMGHAMNHDLVATYPSASAGAATGIEYSHEAAIVVQLVTYIRNLSYQAYGSMNGYGAGHSLCGKSRSGRMWTQPDGDNA